MQHRLDSAREAVSFTRGRSREDLDQNRTRQQVSQIPWQDIVRMRNRLIHAYSDIDLDRVWNTVMDDLPTLIQQAETALAGLDG
jgi:hypothetical protein